DGEKQPVPTLTSNIGHLLWSGIVPDEHVDQLVNHLLGPWLFSGWGVRTLAAGQGVYNPLEYHNGTVWPHDTAIIAAGLARPGRRPPRSCCCGRCSAWSRTATTCGSTRWYPTASAGWPCAASRAGGSAPTPSPGTHSRTR